MKKLLTIVLTVFMTMSLLFINNNDVKAASSSMTVKVDKDNIVITLKNISKAGTIYGYRANSYQAKDQYNGISKLSSSDFTVGTYDPDTSGNTFTVSRYDEDGYDRLYDKYYLISYDNKIIKGPVYATSIDSVTKNIKFTQKSKKGLFNENSSSIKYAQDLGASSITLNIDIGSLCYGTSYSSDAIEFESNGKTYYFDKNAIQGYDQMIIPASKKGMNVIAIILAWSTAGEDTFPDSMRYPGWHQGMFGTNTSTNGGMDQYIATMEFLANRYSQSADTGLISTYVIGNEVDFTNNFYNCKNLNTYMAEYERSLRLANNAVKKYAGDANVAISLTHYWNGDVKKLGKENKGYCLKPRAMLDWLAKVTNAQGAYDWALAPHCYAAVVTTSNPLNSDSSLKRTSGNYKTAKEVTYTNLEVLQAYLSQSKLKYKGKVRSAYLTESGVSSYKKSKESLQQQAAATAFSFLKVANISCIKSYNYYRLRDHKTEEKSHLTSGLLTSSNKKKPAYYVYKYADTLNFAHYANNYINYLSFAKNGNKKNIYSYKKGKIHSYLDTMKVYNHSNVSYSFKNALKSSLKKYYSGTPSGIRRVRKTRSSVTIKWNKTSLASGYRIIVNGKTVGTTKGRTYTVRNLPRKKKNKVRVQAYKTVRGKKYYGAEIVLRVPN